MSDNGQSTGFEEASSWKEKDGATPYHLTSGLKRLGWRRYFLLSSKRTDGFM